MKKKEKLFVDCLESLTKIELEEVANCLSLEFKKRSTKLETRSQIAAFVLASPHFILSKLSRAHLLKLQELLHSSDTGVVFSLLSPTEGLLHNFGFTYVKTEKDINYEFLADDIVEVMSPLIDKYVEESYCIDEYDVETMVLGLINIYGAIDFDNLLIVCKKFNLRMTPAELHELIEGSIELKLIYNPFSGLFISKLVHEVDELLHIIDEGQLPIHTFFTKKEVMMLGNSSCPLYVCKESDKIKDFLLAYKVSEKYIDKILSSLWIKVNNYSETFTLALYISLIEREFHIKINMKEFTRLGLSYFDVIPMWELRGSNNEKIELFTQKLEESPLIALQYLKEHTVQYSQNESFEPTPEDKSLFSTLKVGRNDPCPCGSGKKFKVCCGSN